MVRRFVAVSLCIFCLFISGTALAIEFSADTVTTTGNFTTENMISLAMCRRCNLLCPAGPGPEELTPSAAGALHTPQAG